MSRIHEYGGHGVDVGVKHRRTTPDIFWSSGGNTFVIVRGGDRSTLEHKGTPVDLVSINGIGEIRWDVPGRDIERAADSTSGHLREGLDAFNHFGLNLRHRQNPCDYGECLEENPSTALWLVGGVAAVGILWWFLKKKKTETKSSEPATAQPLPPPPPPVEQPSGSPPVVYLSACSVDQTSLNSWAFSQGKAATHLATLMTPPTLSELKKQFPWMTMATLPILIVTQDGKFYSYDNQGNPVLEPELQSSYCQSKSS